VQALAQDSEACALFLFPTKALAQDQRAALLQLVHAAFPDHPPPVDVYDGDTPQDVRPSIRRRARLLITNPDMLHVSLLPVHATFERFLANLRYVVVDEGHMYKGAFGCHVSAVIRRLRRVCERQYGASPSFAVTSATSSDPATHMKALLGVEEVVVVDDDGSPHGPRLFVMWNPPLCIGNPKGAGQAEDSRHPSSIPDRSAKAQHTKKMKEEAKRVANRSRNMARSGAENFDVQ
jgi:DEAD/DEAH box helicase domain-containing protein